MTGAPPVPLLAMRSPESPHSPGRVGRAGRPVVPQCAVLERLLARAGWTPENLGDRLNELATSLNLRARVHRRTPRRWVCAEVGRTAPRVPRDPWPSLVCHLLHERVGEPVTLDSLGRLALGAARAGDEATWRRAQDRAFDLLARSVPTEEPSWIYWFTEADANGIAGQSLLALGHPGDAEPYLRRTLSLIDPGFARDRAGWLCHLATTRIAMGAVEQACATANEAAALIRRLESPHDRSRLADFRVTAAPYARSAAVREFDAKHRDLLSASLT